MTKSTPRPNDKTKRDKFNGKAGRPGTRSVHEKATDVCAEIPYRQVSTRQRKQACKDMPSTTTPDCKIVTKRDKSKSARPPPDRWTDVGRTRSRPVTQWQHHLTPGKSHPHPCSAFLFLTTEGYCATAAHFLSTTRHWQEQCISFPLFSFSQADTAQVRCISFLQAYLAARTQQGMSQIRHLCSTSFQKTSKPNENKKQRGNHDRRTCNFAQRKLLPGSGESSGRCAPVLSCRPPLGAREV